jgi:replication initiation protein RepC
VDWEPGNSAIIYKSVGVMARELDLSERQIYNLEACLCRVFGLTIRRRADKRRFGRRESDAENRGKILFAYGLDLSPLKEKIQFLRATLKRVEAERAEWNRLKRHLSEEKRAIRELRKVLTDAGDFDKAGIDEADLSILGRRLFAQTSLAELKERLAVAMRLRSQLERAIIAAHAVDISDRSAKNFRPKEYPTEYPTEVITSVCNSARDPLSAPEEVKADISVRFSSGAEHVSVRAAWNAASDRFRSLMGGCEEPGHLVSAAKDSLRRLGISGFQWDEACQILGDYGAALCVLVTERRHRLGQIQAGRSYFQALARRALRGRLAIHKSIFGLIWRDCPNHAPRQGQEAGHGGLLQRA